MKSKNKYIFIGNTINQMKISGGGGIRTSAKGKTLVFETPPLLKLLCHPTQKVVT